MKKFIYLLIFIFSLFFISDVKAAITDDMYFVNYAGFINGAYVYNKSQYINNQPFSITPNSGMAVTFDITFQSDKDLVGQNYILQVDICSEISNYAGGSSPYYFTGDFVFGGHLSHKVQDLGSCQINGYNAFLITDYYLFSILDLTVNSEEGGYVGNGKVGSSGGVYSPNYPISLEISNVSILDYDLSFINGLEQNNSQQETNDKLDQTNEELGEMNDYIQDDTPASTDDIDMDSLGTVSGLLPEGPVDSLLNIPFTFLSVLTSSMGGVCVPITGTFVFDSTLSIPCFDSFYDEVPDYLMNFINLIPSGFILIMYFKHLYKKVERAVSLQTTTDDEWGVI